MESSRVSGYTADYYSDISESEVTDIEVPGVLARLRASMPSSVVVLLIIVACLAIALSASSCGAKTSATYTPPKEADFSKMTWTDAFDQLIQKMQREYAFTEWKSINWESISVKYRPLIKKARSANDFKQYYIALKGFLASVPDGHVTLTGDDQGVMQAELGGGFGIVAIKLDNGRVIAARVTGGSPADAAGMKAGAELVQWGGKAVDKALVATSTVLTKNSLATNEDVTYERLRFLVRAPVGATKVVTFKNPDDAAAKTASLTAVDDGMETLAFTNPYYDFKGLKPQKLVETKTLPGNVGYIKIIVEANMPKAQPGDHTPTTELFKQAVDSLIKANVSGLVLDVRGNLGGDDSMVTDFLSSFYKDRTLYEYGNWYNSENGKMEIWLGSDQTQQYTAPGKSLDIEPGTPRYDGPVVAMINAGCISSGEGVAMGIKNLPNGRVVGFWSTNGSFGMSGDNAIMPAGLTASFPFGQSLDKDKVVQLDSRNGVGGVSPNKKIPMTMENALKWGAGQDVELDYALKALSELQKSK